MKFGCCTNMVSTKQDGTGIEVVELLADIGYDYIELPLAQVMDLSAVEFGRLRKRVALSGLRCEACNNFFPGRIRLTGNEVCMPEALEYIKASLDRAAELGAEIIVFGSSAAKNVPQGFPADKAWGQIADLLGIIGEISNQYGITIAIEPLNRNESNIINTIRQGYAMAKEVNMENIKLLADYYHMSVENEDIDVLLETGNYIKHVHLSCKRGRCFPGLFPEDSIKSFFRCLYRIGYSDRISIEAFTDNFRQDAAKALRFLKEEIKNSKKAI